MQQNPWVGWSEEHAGLPAARCVATLLPGEHRLGTANAVSVQLALARAFDAALVLPEFIARRENDLSLVAAAPYPLLEMPLWIVVNQEVRGLPVVEAVTSWVEECLLELRRKAAKSGTSAVHG